MSSCDTVSMRRTTREAGPRSQAQWSLAIDLLTHMRLSERPLRAELARQLGISTGTMADLVTRLAGHSLLEERSAPASGRGRPSTLLAADPNGPLTAVVDIGAATWRAGVAGLDGVPHVAASGAVEPGRASSTVAEVRQAVEAIVAEHRGRVLVASVSVAAPLRGTRLVQSPALFWDGVDLADLVTGLPLVCGNDATLSCLAEVRKGAAVAASTAVHILVMSGPGGGLCIDGVPAVGASGALGEFGHLPFGTPGVACDCGAVGCWDVVVGAKALARGQVAAGAGAGAARAGEIERFDIEQIESWLCALPREQAPEYVLDAVASLARGVGGLVNALDPQMVTLGGLAIPLRALDPARFDAAYRGALMRYRFDSPPPVVDAVFGADGPLTGAVELGLDALLTPSFLEEWVTARS